MTLIRTADGEDIPALLSLTLEENHVKDNNYFDRCIAEQADGKRVIFLIFADEKLAGYCQYQRFPKYQPFRSLKIPEIQDIYIHLEHRRRGLATSLIDFCCHQARSEKNDLIGIGVSVSSNYGKAQKLYFKLGFEPDGGGAVYERTRVTPGQLCAVDDELCLMLIKPLN